MRIARLEPSSRVPGRWLVWLDDGALVRVTEQEVVSFALYAGMELSDETWAELESAARLSAAREKAVSLLAARPLSRRELIEKLTARPRDREKSPLATPEEAGAVAGRLEELGYLDDGAYAKTVARHYAAKGYGERKIRDELYRRGVPRELWDEALEELEDPAEEIDAFVRKKLRGEAPDPAALKRISDALARRGYRWDDIRDALRRYGAEWEESI